MTEGGRDQKLGQILIQNKILTPQEVAKALASQREHEIKTGERLKLGQILLFSQVLTLDKLQEALRQQTTKASTIQERSKQSKEKWETDRQLLEETYRSFIKPKDQESKRKAADGLISTFINFIQRK